MKNFILDLVNCNYNLLENFKRKVSFGGDDSNQTHCVMQKKEDSIFPTEEDFYKLPIYKS